MIGKHIKKARKAKGLSQEQLAEQLNVTRQAVSNWECGKTQPDIQTLQKLSEVLEVPVEELIYGAASEKEVSMDIANSVPRTVEEGGKKGVKLGVVLAMIISYAKWQSIGWALLHGLFNWAYVIYYIIRYGWS